MKEECEAAAFSDVEYNGRSRITRREEFLYTMNEVISWEEWLALIQPFYFEGKRGHPPRGIEKMLRIYLLQGWFNPSTKNANKERDPEMKQTMKGKEWKFGMKIHIGLDAGSGYVTAV